MQVDIETGIEGGGVCLTRAALLVPVGPERTGEVAGSVLELLGVRAPDGHHGLLDGGQELTTGVHLLGTDNVDDHHIKAVWISLAKVLGRIGRERGSHNDPLQGRMHDFGNP